MVQFTDIKTTLQSLPIYAKSREMRIIIIVVSLFALPAIALNAGIFALPGDNGYGYSGTSEANQNTDILSYDSGVMGYSICWFDGRNHWVGNDFDVTIYSDVNSMIIRTRDDWPNDGFDGFYIAIYNDVGGLPGVIIWPADGKRKVDANEIQANYDEGWVEIDVGYSVDTDTIYACMEQYYNHPDADPFCVDDNPVDQGHSWEDNGNGWRPLDTGDLGDITNNNLMLRLRATLSKGIRVTSLGGIKALYR
jgi:hypothetical protein